MLARPPRSPGSSRPCGSRARPFCTGRRRHHSSHEAHNVDLPPFGLEVDFGSFTSGTSVGQQIENDGVDTAVPDRCEPWTRDRGDVRRASDHLAAVVRPWKQPWPARWLVRRLGLHADERTASSCDRSVRDRTSGCECAVRYGRYDVDDHAVVPGRCEGASHCSPTMLACASLAPTCSPRAI